MQTAKKKPKKAGVYRSYMRYLDPDYLTQYFEVDHLDEERILSCGDDIKAYIVNYYKGKILERSQILYGRSSAEISRSLPPYEGEGEIIIYALPKIHDIIL